MSKEDAFRIVLELAEENVITDPDMEDEASDQKEAIAVVRQVLSDKDWKVFDTREEEIPLTFAEKAMRSPWG